jgi:hypothetical protein
VFSNLVTPAGQFVAVLKLGLEEYETHHSEKKKPTEHNKVYI